MRKAITADKLERVLLGLGFVTTSVPGSHKVYRHPTSAATIVLPFWPGKETVRPIHLVAIQRTLSEKGILDRDSFDDLLQNGVPMRPRIN